MVKLIQTHQTNTESNPSQSMKERQNFKILEIILSTIENASKNSTEDNYYYTEHNDNLRVGIIIFATSLSLAIIFFILRRLKPWRSSARYKICYGCGCRKVDVEIEPEPLLQELQVFRRLTSAPVEVTNGINVTEFSARNFNQAPEAPPTYNFNDDSLDGDVLPPSYEFVTGSLSSCSQILSVQSLILVEESNISDFQAPPPPYIELEIQHLSDL